MVTKTTKEKKTPKPKKRGRPKKSTKKVEVKKEPEKVEVKKRKKPLRYLYAVGRRKQAVARVRYHKKGNGKVIVNEKDYKDFFPEFTLHKIVYAPLEIISWDKTGDITVKVRGGGRRGQAESIRLGIARILVEINNDFKTSLKKEGFLKRDPREKERKKYGLKRARRAPQWQKR